MIGLALNTVSAIYKLGLFILRPVQTDQTWVLTLVKHYQTLLGGVGRCLISVGCWSVQTSRTPLTMLDFGTRHEIMAFFWSRERKCWTMLDEKFKQVQTSSKIVQHWLKPANMFYCAVQMGQTCCVQQCLIMFDQHVWSLPLGLYKVQIKAQ